MRSHGTALPGRGRPCRRMRSVPSPKTAARCACRGRRGLCRAAARRTGASCPDTHRLGRVGRARSARRRNRRARRRFRFRRRASTTACMQAQRQPGSAFKPFLYSAALEHGFTPATLVNDAPIVMPGGGGRRRRRGMATAEHHAQVLRPDTDARRASCARATSCRSACCVARASACDATHPGFRLQAGGVAAEPDARARHWADDAGRHGARFCRVRQRRVPRDAVFRRVGQRLRMGREVFKARRRSRARSARCPMLRIRRRRPCIRQRAPSPTPAAQPWLP